MKRLLILLLLLLPIAPLSAADKTSTLKKLAEYSALRDQAREIASFAVNEIENRKKGLPEEEYQRLKNLIAQTFNEQRLYKAMYRHLEINYDANLSPRWLQHLQSPLMRKIADLEAQSAASDNFPKLIAYAQQLQQQPAPETRTTLINTLDEVTYTSELAVESQLAVAKVLLHAINPSLPSNKQMSTSQIKAALGALRIQTTQNLQRFSLITHLYTYQSLNDKELQQYLALYQSPEGAWASDTIYQAIKAALKDAIQRFQQQA